MGTTEPPQPSSLLPTRDCSEVSSPVHAHTELPQTDLWQRGQPLLLAQQETPRESPCWRLEGTGWKDVVGAKRGWKVVGAQLYSPQVRRSLIPWTKRQTDGPCIPLALFSRLPKGFVPPSFWGAAGVATGSRSQESAWALLPHPHTSIYVQGHTDTDTYKYTQACTHAHKYTHTHKHVPFHRQPLHPGITGEHPVGNWRGGVSSFP